MPRRLLVAIATALALLAAAPAVASAAPPGTATIVPLQVTGPNTTRFNLIVMGDGYQEAEFPKFFEQVDKHLNVLWSIEPYKSYRSYMNVYAIAIVSQDSGIDCDPLLTSPRYNTPLSMGFWGGCSASSVQRLVTASTSATTTYANMVPGTTSANRQILALGNSNTYGGAGGTIATATGGNALSALISPHELGHSLGGLQDEYDYLTRGVPGGTYTGGEPSSIHHTLRTEAQMLSTQTKWWRWLGEPSESGGTIGRFEGGQNLRFGIWRPSKHSIMKSLGYYYDQPTREVMTRAISAKVSLTQGSTPTASPIGADRVVWVETLHPVREILDVTWTVDGVTVPGTDNSRNLDLSTLGLAAGMHTLRAIVVDPTAFVRDPAIRNGTALTKTLTWTVNTALTTTVTGVTPSFTTATSTTAAVAANSVVYAEPTHPTNHVLDIAWKLDSAPVSNPGNNRDLDLKRFSLSSGMHTVTATVSDPTAPEAGSQTMEWSVDAQDAVPALDLSPAAATAVPGAVPEYYYNAPFRMKLTGTDNTPGFVVDEYRVDGDGWQNYYGWPTDSTLGMLFTEFGTNIDDLFYGKLGVPRAVAWDTPPSGQGRHVIEYRAVDPAGNISAPKSFAVTLDLVAPTIAVSHTADGPDGWNSGAPATVTVTAADALAGLDGAPTCLDGASPLSLTPGAPGTWTATLSADGTHAVSCAARDLAGNTASAADTVKVDLNAPVTTATLTPGLHNGWYASPTLTLAADDGAGSGVARIDYSLDGGSWSVYSGPISGFTTGNHFVQYRATDAVGHVEATKLTAFKVDAVKPSVNVATPADGASYPLGKTVNEYVKCVDRESGIDTCVAPHVDTSTVGDHVFTVMATDKAGNVTVVTHHYQVVYRFNGFFAPVSNTETGELNLVHAGDLVKVGFGLDGDRGLAVFAAGFPASEAIPCPSGTPHSVPAAGAGTAPGLSFGVASGHYSYGWQTDAGWAGTCRRFELKLNDGTSTVHTGDFMFFA